MPAVIAIDQGTTGSKAYRLSISAPGYSEHQPVTVQNLQGAVDLVSIAPSFT